MSEFEPFPLADAALYSGGPPALLFGSDTPERAEVAALLAEAGVRLAAAVPLEEAASRLDQQLSLGLAWAECAPGEDIGDALLERLDAQAARGTPVVVSIPPSAIDSGETSSTWRCWSG